MPTTNVDIYIRVEKTDTVRDMPSKDKGVTPPGYTETFNPRPINTDIGTSAYFELTKQHLEETPSRFEKLKQDSNKVIAGANYALEEISKRESGKDISVDPSKYPDIIASMNYLFGPGKHGNKITHDMYTQMMQLIYQFGRYKATGATA